MRRTSAAPSESPLRPGRTERACAPHTKLFGIRIEADLDAKRNLRSFAPLHLSQRRDESSAPCKPQAKESIRLLRKGSGENEIVRRRAGKNGRVGYVVCREGKVECDCAQAILSRVEEIVADQHEIIRLLRIPRSRVRYHVYRRR